MSNDTNIENKTSKSENVEHSSYYPLVSGNYPENLYVLERKKFFKVVHYIKHVVYKHSLFLILSYLIFQNFIQNLWKIYLFYVVSNKQFKLLFNSSVILMDDTFSSPPSMFSQVYCIHTIKYEQYKYKFIIF